MNSKTLIYAFILIVALVAPGCISESDGSKLNNSNDQDIGNIEEIKGLWLGNLSVPNGELRILFNISTEADGSINATMDSPDQGVSGIHVETVTYKDGSLTLEVKSIRGVFEGTLKEDGKTIKGEWKQAGSVFPLVLHYVDKAPETRRAQDPVKPYPYVEEEVTYENKEAGVKLAGTLTYPDSEGPFPAVILISGSGSQNRDEEILGHRPFLVLSDYLTRQGIAVLRVDDRGVGGSTGNFSEATTEDFTEDVLAGVEYLKSRKDINPSRIGLVGHSEGGLVAPLAAVKSQDIAFIVLMAGPGVNGEKIILSQNELILRAEGADNDTITRNDALMKKLFSVVKEEQNDTIAREELKKIINSELENMSKEQKQYSDFSEVDLDTQIQPILSPWMRFFLVYDPVPTLKEVKCPVLAINGEKDLQVSPDENLPEIEKALKEGGNQNYSVKELPGLNHLFQKAQTGSPSEYAKIEETISPDALELIGNWISEHTKKEK